MTRRSLVGTGLGLVLLLGWGCGDDGGENSNQNNNNVSPVCGNGLLETGEQCDDGEANDDVTPGACRTSCRTAHCGDGVIDLGEVCDTAALAGRTCVGEGYTAGVLSCSAACELDLSGCTTCGNGDREGEEACDGADVGGQNCSTQGAGQHGILRCDGDCHFDASGCHTCGDGTVEPAEACEPGHLPSCAEAGYSGGSRQCSSTCDIIGACESVCGNGIVEPGEGCDGLALGEATCESLGFYRGELACSASCQVNTGGCTSCGDGVIDVDEACDGTELNGATCRTTLGNGYSGVPGCTAGCQLDLSGCVAPPVCGNGSLDVAVGERCDGAALGGYTCATWRPGVYGSGTLACRPNCTFDESGCVREEPCGNGVRDEARGEACDGLDLGGQTCVGLAFPGGTLRCGTDCRYDLSGCEPPLTCNGGGIDLGELCDGANLGSQTCETAGFQGGTLACTPNCRLDLSGCTNCGNGSRDAGEVCDGTALGGVTCQSLGYHTGTVTCDGTCSALVTTGCAGVCGDGTLDPTEVCDGTALGGATCQSFGYYEGTLGCEAGCGALVTTGCGESCGDGTINGSEVCDGTALGGATCSSLGYESGILACNGTCSDLVATGCTGQQAGDCHAVSCDGEGHTTEQVDDSDVPVDGLECTDDVCDLGVPSNPWRAEGTGCTEGGAEPGECRSGRCVRPTVWVVNSGLDAVQVVDPAEGVGVVATVPVGTNPLFLAITPDGLKVYVTNYGSNNVSVISTVSWTVTATIAVDTLPYSVAVTPDGSRVYVSNSGSKTVSVIDSTTDTVIDSISLAAGAGGLAVKPDGTELWVSAGYGPDILQVLSIPAHTVLHSAGAGSAFIGDIMRFLPDSSVLYAASVCGCCGNVRLFNGSTYAVLTTNSWGNPGGGVAISPDGSRAYGGATGSGCNGASKLVKMNGATGAILSEVVLPVGRMAVSPEGATLYVLEYPSPNLVVSDAVSLATVRTFDLGGTTTDIAVQPQ